MPTAPSTEQAIASRIAELEDRRWRLLVAGDLDAFERMLADDLVYIHTTGRIDSKASLMNLRRSASVRFLKFEEEDQRIRVYGESVAVLTACIRNWQTTGDTHRIAYNRFTSVWIRSTSDPGEWLVSSYHATKLPPANT